MSATLVFVGPSLSRTEARALLPEAIILPPAGQGDVYRAIRDRRPARVALIDGAFLAVPAVWHRELLWGLAEGVAMYGAASMGALRAVELAPFGMRGTGKIFEAYRDGAYPPFEDAFEDDDEVAVVHAPGEAGGAALSDAMVDLRETLAGAQAAGMVDRSQRDRLAAAMKALHFPERSMERLAEAALAMAGEAAAAWLAAHPSSRKAMDARALLGLLAGEDRAERPTPAFRFEQALVWERFRAEADRPPESPEEAMALGVLARDPKAWRQAESIAAGRLGLLAHRRAVEDADIRAALDAFRRARGLLTRSGLEQWLRDNAASERDLLDLLAREAGTVAPASPDLRRAMLDHLRLEGRFAGLLSTAQGSEGT